MLSEQLIKLLEAESKLFGSSIHGLKHWRAVERNGLYLSDFTGADKKVVSLFAYFHDCMRENDWIDPEHGPRGAEFALKHANLLQLTDSQLKVLVRACRGHTHGTKSLCKTVATCWDADRLDIGRGGITPDAKYLLTDEAKRIADAGDQECLLSWSGNFNLK